MANGNVEYDVKLSLEETIDNLEKLVKKSVEADKQIKELNNTFDSIGNSDPFSRLYNDIDDTKRTLIDLSDATKNVSSDLNKLDGVTSFSAVQKDTVDLIQDFDKVGNSARDLESDLDKAGNSDSFDNIKKDVKNFDSELEEATKDTKKFNDEYEKVGKSKGGGGFTELIDGLEEMDNAIGSSIKSGKNLIGTMSGMVKPIGAVVGAVTLGVAAWQKYDKHMTSVRYASKKLEGQISETNATIDEQTEAVKNLEYAGFDYEESLDAVMDANKIFGSELENTSETMEGALTIMGLQKAGFDDIEGFYTEAQIGASIWNQSQAENNEMMGRSIGIMKQYGNRGEDIVDTIQEWGDTAEATGQSSSDMFDLINDGLVAGARNTDEVLNSWNEFTIRIGDGTAQKAIEELGFSWEDTVKKFNKGGKESQEVYYELIKALSETKNATERTALAQQIFGTQGEEYIATVFSQTEKTDALIESLKAQEKQEDFLRAGRENDKTWEKIQNDMNLTSGELSELIEKYDTQGLSALNAEEQNILLGNSYDSLKEKLKLNSEQIEATDAAWAVFNDGQQVTTENSELVKNGIETLGDALGFSEEKVKSMQQNIDVLNNGFIANDEVTNTMIDNLEVMAERGDISSTSINALKTEVSNLSDSSFSAEERTENLSSLIDELGRSGAISGEQMSELKEQMKIYQSETSTAEEKTAALKTVIEEVGTATGLTDKEISDLEGSLIDAGDATDKASDKQSEFAKKLEESKEAQEDSRDALESMIEIQLASMKTSELQRLKTVANTTGNKELTEAIKAVEEANKENSKWTKKSAYSQEENTKAMEGSKTMADWLSGSLTEKGNKTDSDTKKTSENTKKTNENKESVSGLKGIVEKLNGTPRDDIDFDTNASDEELEVDGLLSKLGDFNLWQPQPKTLTITQKFNKQGGVGNDPYGPNQPSPSKPKASARNYEFSPDLYLSRASDNEFIPDFGSANTSELDNNTTDINYNLNLGGINIVANDSKSEAYKEDLTSAIIEVTEEYYGSNIEVNI